MSRRKPPSHSARRVTRPAAGFARQLLWRSLNAAGRLEQHLRRAGHGRPAPRLGAESSSGRFIGPCGFFPDEPRKPAAVRLLVTARRLPWQPLTLAGFVGVALLGGALVGTVRSGRGHEPAGQVAIADGPSDPGPARISAFDRAVLARSAEAAHAPERPDTMSAEHRSPAEKGSEPQVIRRVGAGDEKTVSLTFDDGPNAITTPRILAALKREQVPATFFLIGSQVEHHPSLARQALAEGHQLGSHTWNHFYLNHMDAAATHAEMEVTSRLIEHVTGVHPRWFRPPGGYYTNDVLKEAQALDQRVVLWTVDSRDWSAPGEAVLHRRLLRELKPGAIILLHDTSSQTAAILPQLIRDVRAKGYRFVPLEAPAAPASPGPAAASAAPRRFGKI